MRPIVPIASGGVRVVCESAESWRIFDAETSYDEGYESETVVEGQCNTSESLVEEVGSKFGKEEAKPANSQGLHMVGFGGTPNGSITAILTDIFAIWRKL